MIELIAHVTCPHCSKSQGIDCRDYVSDMSCNEREMGSECEYTIKCEAYKCQECGRYFALEGSIWEYPECVENLNEVSATNTEYVADNE